ncbi:Clavaminate synthase-like protein [Plenodomus tracheiphilus IPT5]|uniref:Clavaminate synthase-like protein n=1 Tax=Plenodomus tracheiphilus IPT5 TaxID=1408161 RepID=A0A6A7BKS0_9PLEO|nr:Clavaminate synthase-like protein [Plenodomus tracheiphilus IPT5]
MLQISRLLPKGSPTRCYSSVARFSKVRSVQYDGKQSIDSFDTTQPALFKNSFADLPARSKWFTHDTHSHAKLTPYLSHHDASLVSLELTRSSPSPSDPQPTTFERFDAPLSLLLSHMTGPETPDTRLYLAQHSLSDLPEQLQHDLPTPLLFTQLGRGDIYSSSLWMGRPPTRTPLHRDPNPNLFVQLAGRKVVRLLRPEVGRGVYEWVRSEVGKGGGRASMRGVEMMEGEEMVGLENAVWGSSGVGEGVEAELESGDGLYIPLGWWHAVHGIGKGANASVNWWFR